MTQNNKQPNDATITRRSCEFYNTKIKRCSRSSERCEDPSKCSDYKTHLDYTPNEKVLLEHLRHGYKLTLCGNPRDELYRRKQEYIKMRNIYTNDIVFAKIRTLEIAADESAGKELAKAVAWNPPREYKEYLEKENKEQLERINEERTRPGAYLIRHPEKLERIDCFIYDCKEYVLYGMSGKNVAYKENIKEPKWRKQVEKGWHINNKMVRLANCSYFKKVINRVDCYQYEHPNRYMVLLLTFPIWIPAYIMFKIFSVFFAIISFIDPVMRFLDGDTPGFLSPGDGKIDIPDGGRDKL